MLENWYVIQVFAGKEEEMKKKILSIVDHSYIEECFIPRYQKMKKYQGKWHQEEEVLFPGYLFIITDHIHEVYVELNQIPALTKILGREGGYINPLPMHEALFISRFGKEEHLVDMSIGYIEGDVIKVTNGPLMGQEGLIRKIDRHKRIAMIEVEFFGQVTTAKVGLEIIRKT